MTNPLNHLEPKVLWTHFDKLRAIPRPSGDESGVIDYIDAFASGQGWKVLRDEVGNVCVRVPATAGNEARTKVVLQSHLDMVCEKESASGFDFSRDTIQADIDGDWVVARGTTLGADNGIGVAAALSVCEQSSFAHGPVELLFTVDEEASLRGAKGLDPAFLQGRVLLNLDSITDEELIVGSAGGCDMEIEYGAQRAPAPDGLEPFRLSIGGLLGGHSGLSIHENRGNAIRILARILRRYLREQEVFVWAIEGGNKPTAIPREAHALFFAPAKFMPRAREIADEIRAAFMREIGQIDSNLQMKIQAEPRPHITPFNCSSTRRLVRLLNALPHGVLAMSQSQPTQVHSSTNLASVRTDVDRVTLVTSSRSMLQWSLDGVLNQIDAISRLAGAATEQTSAYPPWRARKDSLATTLAAAAYQKVHGSKPRLATLHGGLECGVLSERIPDIDIVSFGPKIEGAHAPGERVNIPSVKRFHDFLIEFLSTIP